MPRCSCCPWTAPWRAHRRHCSNEVQGKAIDAGLTVVAAESSPSYSGVIGPVTRVLRAAKDARHGRETPGLLHLLRAVLGTDLGTKRGVTAAIQ